MLAQKGIPVTLLARTPEEADGLNSCRQHLRLLPGVIFPQGLKITNLVARAVAPARLVILAVPSASFRQNVRWVRDSIAPEAIILSATKGLELPNGRRMSQILKEELPSRLHSGICVLSGPNLAKEIVQGKPASTVIASPDPARAEEAQALLMSSSFRVYTSNDVVGVELGGALKNIIALGAGIADGLNMGDNGKAAFISRGLAEITRLGVAAGAHPMTFAGLAGLGDLIATCASRLSRNRYVGEQLALGKPWPEIQRSMSNVAEGVNTTCAALAMAEKLHVDMPITEATYRVLFEGLPPQQAVAGLMGRPPRAER
jgi:glycerol-3-phosphate dehydrogenase (NAD(P)+)